MEWKAHDRGFIGSDTVEIRSIKITDHQGRRRRFRVSTVREPAGDFTKMPAEARLFKTENGHIGALITGKYGGYVKVGKTIAVQQSFSIPLSGLSKLPVKKILKGTYIELIELDGIVVGIER